METQVWSQDVHQAYLQSFENPTRKAFTKPPKELDLSGDESLELLKPL